MPTGVAASGPTKSHARDPSTALTSAEPNTRPDAPTRGDQHRLRPRRESTAVQGCEEPGQRASRWTGISLSRPHCWLSHLIRSHRGDDPERRIRRHETGGFICQAAQLRWGSESLAFPGQIAVCQTGSAVTGSDSFDSPRTRASPDTPDSVEAASAHKSLSDSSLQHLGRAGRSIDGSGIRFARPDSVGGPCALCGPGRG